jgi:hypothetical protein
MTPSSARPGGTRPDEAQIPAATMQNEVMGRSGGRDYRRRRCRTKWWGGAAGVTTGGDDAERSGGEERRA